VTRSAVRQSFDVLVLIALMGLVWQGLYEYAGEVALTSPLQTAALSSQLIASPDFWPHLEETGLALLQGLVIAIVCGLAVGLMLGAHRLAGEVAEPILVALYSIPKVTLYPVILLIFGIGMPAKVAFGAIHGIVPISIFAMNAVRNINPTHLRTARVLRLPPWTLFSKVLVPAALPEIVTGIRVGFSLSLIGTLLGEMFGSQHGLGHLLMQAMSLHNIERILALTLLLVAFAAGVNALLLALDRRLHGPIG
jgi:NitT/TauT family transport system permease protein